MDTATVGRPHLDRSGEPWVGRFPGLGCVEVDGDGEVRLHIEESQDEAAPVREAALRFGWGEGLSLLRRGFQLANGAAVCPPGKPSGCLLLNGDDHDTAIMILHLTQRGWNLLADGFTPTTWSEGKLVAWPRETPLLVSQRRLRKAGLTGKPVRARTDACAVPVPRAVEARMVSAVCQLGMRKAGEVVMTPLTGHDRFEAAASLMLGGALSPDVKSQPVEDIMAEHLRIAALPHCRLRLDSATCATDAEALLMWWADLAGGDTA